MAEENQPYRDETDGGEEAPPQRSFLRKDEGGSRNYVVKDNQYVLTNEETVQKCHCCDEPCRYFNFYRCQTEPANCMQDMPSAISICTHQFSEFDNLNRACDGEPTRWWFRVRFWDGEGLSGTGCYSGSTSVVIPKDPNVEPEPPGTEEAAGMVVERVPKLFNYCSYECLWPSGSIPGTGLPRIVEEKNDGCAPQDNPNCQHECGYWDYMTENDIEDFCSDCCEHRCYFVDYSRCSSEEDCSAQRDFISVLCRCTSGATGGTPAGTSDWEFCCPDGCGNPNLEASCMPPVIQIGNCCYSRKPSPGVYAVDPSDPDAGPNHDIYILGNPPCGDGVIRCTDPICNYTDWEEDDDWIPGGCRKPCRDCWCVYNSNTGQWEYKPRTYGRATWQIMCVDAICVPDHLEPYGSNLDEDCGMSISVILEADNPVNPTSWFGDKFITRQWGSDENPYDQLLRYRIELLPTTQCRGCGYDNPNSSLSEGPWYKAGCLDGCGTGDMICHCENGGADCEDCSEDFCLDYDDPCVVCALGRELPTCPCQGEDDPSWPFCYPYERGPCGSCCGCSDCLGYHDYLCAPWTFMCESVEAQPTECCGWWPGDGSWAKCHEGPNGTNSCGFLVRMSIAKENEFVPGAWVTLSQSEQCVHCPGGTSCELIPMSENVHFPHESGCGGTCVLCDHCQDPVEDPWADAYCWYGPGQGDSHGKVYICTDLMLYNM